MYASAWAQTVEVAVLALKAMSEDPDAWDDPDAWERMHWEMALRDARATEIPIPQNAGAPPQTAVAATITHEDYSDIASELRLVLEHLALQSLLQTHATSLLHRRHSRSRVLLH